MAIIERDVMKESHAGTGESVNLSRTIHIAENNRAKTIDNAMPVFSFNLDTSSLSVPSSLSLSVPSSLSLSVPSSLSPLVSKSLVPQSLHDPPPTSRYRGTSSPGRGVFYSNFLALRPEPCALSPVPRAPCPSPTSTTPVH